MHEYLNDTHPAAVRLAERFADVAPFIRVGYGGGTGCRTVDGDHARVHCRADRRPAHRRRLRAVRTSVEASELRALVQVTEPAARTGLIAEGRGMFTVEDTRLELRAAGREFTVAAARPSSTAGDNGKVVAPLRPIGAWVKHVTGAVELEVIDDDLWLRAGTSELTVPTSPTESYPQPRTVNGDTYTWDEPTWLAVKAVALAMGTDDSRPSLTALYVGGGQAAATDTYRLHWCDAPGPDEQVAVPAALTRALIRGAGDTVTWTFAEHHISATSGSISWQGPTSAATHPHWRPAHRTTSWNHRRVTRRRTPRLHLTTDSCRRRHRTNVAARTRRRPHRSHRHPPSTSAPPPRCSTWRHRSRSASTPSS